MWDVNSMLFSTDFDILTLTIIAGITVSQSLFGVGILLWGTPIFLLLGENFIQTLALLLPLSLMISFLQIILKIKKIDKNIFKSFLKYSLPGIFIGLNIVIIYKPNINLMVAIILCASIGLKIKILSQLITRAISKFDNLSIFIIGLIHGLSNLGGPLLVSKISLEKFDKESFRSLIASIYFLFALIQLSIITLQVGHIVISVNYLLFSALTYFFINQCVFVRMNETVYDLAITLLMILMAMLLFAKYFYEL